jgi:eukaryotic-like serine/threonine-protein kinase
LQTIAHVWLGEDELAGRLVAVKELRSPEGVTEAEREVFRKRALQEARSAARWRRPSKREAAEVPHEAARPESSAFRTPLVKGIW